MVELLPYNWEWRDISQLYRNITRGLGDVTHLVWRARSPEWAMYGSEADARYAHWRPEECESRWGSRF